MSWCSICKICKWWWNSRKFFLLPKKIIWNKQNPSVFHILSLYLETESLSRRDGVGGCTDGGPSLVVFVAGFNTQRFGGLAESSQHVFELERESQGDSQESGRPDSLGTLEVTNGQKWDYLEDSCHYVGHGKKSQGGLRRAVLTSSGKILRKNPLQKEIWIHFQRCLGLCERKDISTPRILA